MFVLYFDIAFEPHFNICIYIVSTEILFPSFLFFFFLSFFLQDSKSEKKQKRMKVAHRSLDVQRGGGGGGGTRKEKEREKERVREKEKEREREWEERGSANGDPDDIRGIEGFKRWDGGNIVSEGTSKAVKAENADDFTSDAAGAGDEATREKPLGQQLREQEAYFFTGPSSLMSQLHQRPQPLPPVRIHRPGGSPLMGLRVRGNQLAVTDESEASANSTTLPEDTTLVRAPWAIKPEGKRRTKVIFLCLSLIHVIVICIDFAGTVIADSGQVRH